MDAVDNLILRKLKEESCGKIRIQCEVTGGVKSSGPALSWRAGRPTMTLHFSSKITRDVKKVRSDAQAERHRGYQVIWIRF